MILQKYVNGRITDVKPYVCDMIALCKAPDLIYYSIKKQANIKDNIPFPHFTLAKSTSANHIF